MEERRFLMVCLNAVGYAFVGVNSAFESGGKLKEVRQSFPLAWAWRERPHC